MLQLFMHDPALCRAKCRFSALTGPPSHTSHANAISQKPGKPVGQWEDQKPDAILAERAGGSKEAL